MPNGLVIQESLLQNCSSKPVQPEGHYQDLGEIASFENDNCTLFQPALSDGKVARASEQKGLIRATLHFLLLITGMAGRKEGRSVLQ